ncbi:Putative ATP-dependent RNA helicase DHX30, partial [Eufriesea mexicana]
SGIKKLHVYPTKDLLLIYNYVNSEYNKHCISYNYKCVDGFNCTICVTWPYEASFSAIAPSKKQAMHNASILCLHWLYKLEKVKNLRPVLYDNETIQDMLYSQEYVKINITPDIKAEMEILIQYYNDVVKSRIAALSSELNEYDLKNELKDNFSNVKVLGRNRHTLKLKKRDKEQTDLPVNNYKKEILNSLQNNQVLVIKGDTGCGKSTQIPQFILDSYVGEDRIHECNIIVTQPRRISAVSLARYIAHQRQELLGTTVGFQIRFTSKIPKICGSILFCTNGILLQRFNCNNSLEGVSHIIIDEAHERSIEIDILLKLFKDRLKDNPHLKLIIMSASINVKIFQQYFSCPVINVPGKLYDVKMHFLDDIDLPFEKSMNLENAMKTNIYYDKIVDLIQLIITKKLPGGILCFVPGWKEITQLRNILESRTMNNTNLLILPLHSKLSFNMQQEVFKNAPANTTKIVLATDIVETGITIPDISYVIDTAIKRDQYWDKVKSISTLQYSRISQANILQRKGRAGRLKPGESYHLLTRKEYDKLKLYPIPELLKSELDKVIICCKTMTKENIYDFFSGMIEPPSNTSLRYAVNNLINFGILDENEDLTSLGKRISHMTLNLKLSKAVVLSCVFGCLNPILLLAVIFSSQEYNNVALDEELNLYTGVRSNKKEYHKTSDHIATLKYLENKCNIGQSHTFITFENSNEPKLQQLYELHLNELVKSKMISSIFNIESVNLHTKNNELIGAVLFAATCHLIKNNAYGIKSGYFTKKANILLDEHEKIVKIKSESINSDRTLQPNELLTYLNKMEYAIRHSTMVCDTSVISPLSVLLFSQGDVYCTEMTDKLFIKDRNIVMQLKDINNLNLICEEESAKLLIKFRSILWNIVNFIIKYEGTDDYKDRLYFVKSFKNDLIDLVLRMLNKSSIHTDDKSDKNEYFN